MKNCFDRTPHTMKDWLLLAAGAAAVFAAADWLPGAGPGRFSGCWHRLAGGCCWPMYWTYPRAFLRKSSLAAGAAGRWL